MEFLSYLISGISLGSVYAIIALGYTMVYGIAKMLNPTTSRIRFATGCSGNCRARHRKNKNAGIPYCLSDRRTRCKTGRNYRSHFYQPSRSRNAP